MPENRPKKSEMSSAGGSQHPSWAIFGRFWAPFWRHFGSKNRVKIEGVFAAAFWKVRERILLYFWLIFAALERWKSNATPFSTRSVVKWKNLKKPCIFNEKWGFALQPTMQKQEQEATRDLKNTLAAPNEYKSRFLIDLGSILGPFWVPKSIQNHIKIKSENRCPKIDQKKVRCPPRVVQGGSHSEPFWRGVVHAGFQSENRCEEL